MKRKFGAGLLGIFSSFLLPVFMASVSGMAGPKIYWHFTFEAFVDPRDPGSVEWAWVTMVEVPADKVYEAEAAEAKELGGKLRGTVFAQVRGAAWRSRHRHAVRTRCHDKPAEMEVFWEESESESVYCAGQIVNPYWKTFPRTGERKWVTDEFKFQFTSRRILHEDGRWEDLESQAHVFLGAIHVEGQPREETRGHFSIQSVNYRDPLVHYRRCGKAWAEQYITTFRHFEVDSLRSDIPAVGDYKMGQEKYGPHDSKHVVWEVHRSSSRDHPHWKQKTM